MTMATKTASRAQPFLVAVTTALIGTLVGIALTGVASPVGIAGPPTAVLVAIPLVRIVLDISAVATLGLSLLAVLVGYDRPKLSEPPMRFARRAAVASGLVWSVSALVTLLLETRERGVTSNSMGLGDVFAYVGDVGSGKALLIVASLAAAHCVLSALAVRHGEKVPAEARVGLALFALLPLPVTGHATNWNFHDYTMLSMELHVMAAAAWTGGLGALAVVLHGHRAVLATALPKFSKLATICLVVTAASGLFNAIVELQIQPNLSFFAALFETSYGLLVVGKILCAAGIAVAGARLRWRLMPSIADHKHTAFAAWATLELAIMGLAFGFAVVLTRAPVA